MKSPARDHEPNRSAIVLVHGIGGNRMIMWPLAHRLRRVGYRVKNWGYFSLLGDTKRHGRRLATLLRKLCEDDSLDSVHLVAHSMGAIVSRSALAEFEDELPERIRSAVFLTPPNRGSPIASFFQPILGRVIKPVPQLATDDDSFVNTLPLDPGVPFGIIAAKRDWVIPLANTQLPAQRDHIVVDGIHSMVVMRKDVVELIRKFLQQHSFEDGARD